MTAVKQQTNSKKVVGRPFKKGQSGNPAGRPKNEHSIPNILRELSAKINEYDPDKKQTILEGICAKATLDALGGDKAARDWVADRMEGKSVERIQTQEVNDELEIK